MRVGGCPEVAGKKKSKFKIARLLDAVRVRPPEATTAIEHLAVRVNVSSAEDDGVAITKKSREGLYVVFIYT